MSLFNNKRVEIEGIYSDSCNCPKCGVEADEFDGTYGFVNGVRYPQFLNEIRDQTAIGNFHDWQEVHYCLECEIQYYFDNGI